MQDKKIIHEVIHGMNSFPFDIFLNDTDAPIYDNKQFVYCHWHNDVEIIYISKGRAVFEINTQQIEVCEGQALFINSGDIHTGQQIDGLRCELYAIVFNPDMLNFTKFDICQERYIAPIIRNEYKLPLHIQGLEIWETEILKHIRNIISIFFKHCYGYELAIKSSLYSILSEIIVNGKYIIQLKENNSYRHQSIKRLKTVLEYINCNYDEKLYVESLAKLIGMSGDNFYRFFKSFTGKTPINYINYHRIEKAAELLQSSKSTVLDIALTVGFNNISYFIKTFKKVKKCTPSEFISKL